MTDSARGKLEKQLAAAQAAEERAVMGLIQLELDERTAGSQAGLDQAKAALEEAAAALTEPLAQLAALAEKIAAAEEKCSGLRQQISELDGDEDDDDAPGKIAAAKIHLAEWEARVTRLRSKRDFAESGFQPLFEARHNAEAWVKVFKGAKWEVAAGIADPFGPLGQQTEAYENYRMPCLFPVLLLQDRKSREWDKAVQELEFLVRRLGYKLVFDAELAAQALRSEMADASDAVADPGPNMVDVMAQTDAEMANLALQKSPTRIEGPGYSAPLPRNPPPRSWMQLPGRGAR